MEFDLISAGGFYPPRIYSLRVFVILFIWVLVLFLINARRIWRVKFGIRRVLQEDTGTGGQLKGAPDETVGSMDKLGHSKLAKLIKAEAKSVLETTAETGSHMGPYKEGQTAERIKEFFLFKNYSFFIVFLLWALATFRGLWISFFNAVRGNALIFDKNDPLKMVQVNLNTILDLDLFLLISVAVIAFSVWAFITLKFMTRSLIYSARRLESLLISSAQDASKNRKVQKR